MRQAGAVTLSGVATVRITPMSDPAILPAFTIGQHKALLAWSSTRPRGFRHVLAHCYSTAEEVAELTQREAYDHLYRISPVEGGKVKLETKHGYDAWEMDTVEEALAELLIIEAELEVEWIARDG